MPEQEHQTGQGPSRSRTCDPGACEHGRTRHEGCKRCFWVGCGTTCSGRSSTAIHTLTLSGECSGCGPVAHDEPCVNSQHDYDYDLTCSGVTDACRAWEECMVCTPEDSVTVKEMADGGEDAEAHGKEHRVINGLWMTPTDNCFIACHENQGEAVAYLGSLPHGRYAVDGEDIGDGDLGLTLVTSADASTLTAPARATSPDPDPVLSSVSRDGGHTREAP